MNFMPIPVRYWRNKWHRSANLLPALMDSSGHTSQGRTMKPVNLNAQVGGQRPVNAPEESPPCPHCHIRKPIWRVVE